MIYKALGVEGLGFKLFGFRGFGGLGRLGLWFHWSLCPNSFKGQELARSCFCQSMYGQGKGSCQGLHISDSVLIGGSGTFKASKGCRALGVSGFVVSELQAVISNPISERVSTPNHERAHQNMNRSIKPLKTPFKSNTTSKRR